jgi:hypothetical protein
MLAIFAFLFQAWAPSAPAPVFPTYPPSKTYPRFSQPILTHANGSRWYLEVTNAGVLQVGGRTLDAATPIRDVQLLDDTAVSAYRLALTAAVPPLLQTIPLREATFGYHKDLPVWSVNGREWTIRVSQAGAISVVGASSNWPMTPNLGIPTNTPAPTFQQPMVAISGGRSEWKLFVSESGIWDLQQQYDPVKTLSSAYLWTQDDTLPFQVTVTEDGVLTVVDAPSTIPRIYELILVSPGGTFFTLVGNIVDHDIILSVTSTLYDAMNARDEWPLVISQHGNYLYIADDRFPPPLPGVGRRWGQRKRQPRRNA